MRPDQRRKQNHKGENLAFHQESFPLNERKWIDIEPGNSSLSAYEVSIKVINLLRHCQTAQREDDGEVHFWRIKNFLRNQFSQIQHWSDERWKTCLTAGGGSKRRYQYCSDNFGTVLLRPCSSGTLWDVISLILHYRDNVIIQRGLFHHIYHIGCAFNLHSIINNGLIPGGQDSSRRQTVFFLPIDPRDKNHKDPEHIDFSAPRRARYVHSARKRHQDSVYWVDIDLAIKEGLTFYQTRSNAIFFKKHSSLLYSKSCQIENWRSLILDHHQRSHYATIGPEGKFHWVVKLINSQLEQSFGEAPRVKLSKPTQSKPNPICDQSGKPEDTERVFVEKGKTSRSQEIDDKRLHKELGSSDRTR